MNKQHPFPHTLKGGRVRLSQRREVPSLSRRKGNLINDNKENCSTLSIFNCHMMLFQICSKNNLSKGMCLCMKKKYPFPHTLEGGRVKLLQRREVRSLTATRSQSPCRGSNSQHSASDAGTAVRHAIFSATTTNVNLQSCLIGNRPLRVSIIR